MAYTFEADVPTRKEIQHFEMLGDRAVWHRGWKAVARHPKGTDFDADQWELYHLDDDFAELNDLAAAEPDRLRKMIELWWSEAGKYGVLPLDDRDWERGAERLRMDPNTVNFPQGPGKRVIQLKFERVGPRAGRAFPGFFANFARPFARSSACSGCLGDHGEPVSLPQVYHSVSRSVLSTASLSAVMLLASMGR
jgi:hypothetical protein